LLWQITGPDTPEEVRGLTAPQVLYKGKKMIFHSLRYLVFAHQLLETGRIYDFKAATVYWDQLKDEQFLNWDYYQTNYYPIYRGLLDKLPSNKAARKSPEELESVPSQFHRMFYLVSLPKHQVNYLEAIEKECLQLIREAVAVRLGPLLFRWIPRGNRAECLRISILFTRAGRFILHQYSSGGLTLSLLFFFSPFTLLCSGWNS
jgi:hypothetical protein